MKNTRLKILIRTILEFALFDSRVVKTLVGIIGAACAAIAFYCGRPKPGFDLAARIHRSAFLDSASRWIEDAIRRELACDRKGGSSRLGTVLRQYVASAAPTPDTKRYFQQPESLLNGNTLVLKSPRDRERGVLCLYYSYTYQLFARFFDVEAIAQRYYLVLEPSWSGFCDPNILYFTRLPHPVFVGAIEPRDGQFIAGLRSNLRVAPVSGNSWVDHRLFAPLPGVQKDFDVVMVAAWASYKRHWAFFRGLGRARKAGRRLRVALVGYPTDLSREDIASQAAYYGVLDQIEFLENQTQAEVNALLNRSKVNVLWSRREGVNRAIIEGMFAGVPCLLREGFNYGYHYPYINEETGQYADEDGLSVALVDMVERYSQYSPRQWVLDRMSCKRSAEILNGLIRDTALTLGEGWSTDIAVKTNGLHGLQYWDPSDAERFSADYDLLRRMAFTTR